MSGAVLGVRRDACGIARGSWLAAGTVAVASSSKHPRLFPTRTQFDYIVLKDLKRKIGERAGAIHGRILDYGCGSKPYASLFTHGKEYLGADFSINPQADILLSSEGLLPVATGHFDAVVSFQVLEHVPDPSTYLSECRRVLKNGQGKLLLTTHGIWQYHPCPGDFHRWTHEGIRSLLARAGFQVTEVEPSTTGMRSLLQLAVCQFEQNRWLPFSVRSNVYRVLNILADWYQEGGAVEQKLYDLPICYLCIGEC